MEKYIILIDTVCQGLIPYVWTTNDDGVDTPELYDTERDAQKEVASDVIEKLSQFINDELEVMEFGEEQKIIPCVVKSDGSIIDEHGELIWSPLEDQSKYGR